MGPYQVLPLQTRVDLGAMAMKGYSAFPNASVLELHHQLSSVIYRTLVEERGSCPSTERQSVYSKAPADWVLEMQIRFTNPSARAGYDTRSIFKAEYNRFEFRVFLLLDSLPKQG